MYSMPSFARAYHRDICKLRPKLTRISSDGMSLVPRGVQGETKVGGYQREYRNVARHLGLVCVRAYLYARTRVCVCVCVCVWVCRPGEGGGQPQPFIQLFRGRALEYFAVQILHRSKAHVYAIFRTFSKLFVFARLGFAINRNDVNVKQAFCRERERWTGYQQNLAIYAEAGKYSLPVPPSYISHGSIFVYSQHKGDMPTQACMVGKVTRGLYTCVHLLSVGPLKSVRKVFKRSAIIPPMGGLMTNGGKTVDSRFSKSSLYTIY